MKKGQDSWCGLAWRRERPVEILLCLFNTSGGMISAETLFSGSLGTGYGTTFLNRKRVCLDWLLGKNYSLWRWWCTGIDCPEKLCLPHPFKRSRPGWMGFAATWSSGRQSLPVAWGLKPNDFLRSLQTQTIQWLYAWGGASDGGVVGDTVRSSLQSETKLCTNSERSQTFDLTY